jgi:hypothetical protein
MHTIRKQPLAALIAALFVGGHAGLAFAQPTGPGGSTAAAAPPAVRPLDEAALRRIDLPAAALERSLAALAREFGILLAVDPALAAGRTSPALSGSFSAREAFARLLAGTGLAIVVRADGGYALVRAADAAQGGERVLTPIHVVATPLVHPAQQVGTQAREAFGRGRSSSSADGDALRSLSPANKGDALRYSTTGFVGGPWSGDRFGGTTSIRTFGDWGAAESIAGLPAFKSAGEEGGGFTSTFLPSIAIDTIHVRKGGHGVGFGDGTDGGVIEYRVKSGRNYQRHQAATLDLSSVRETLLQAEAGHHTDRWDYYLAGSGLYGNYKGEPENLHRQTVVGLLGNFGWNFSDTMRAEVLLVTDSSKPDIIRRGAIENISARQTLASATLDIALREARSVRLGFLRSDSRTQWPARNRDRSVNNDIAFAEHNLRTSLGQGLRYDGIVGLEYKQTEYLRDRRWVANFDDVSLRSLNTLTIGDNLGLTAGARLIRFRNDIVLDGVRQRPNLKDDQVLAYELGASYNVLAATRVRAVLASGFNRFFEKYGNFGTDALNPAGAGDDIVESRTVEAGVRHALGRGSHVDLAVYNITQDGVPRRRAGAIESMKVEQSGAELELVARLLPALQLKAGYMRVLSLEATRADGRKVHGNIFWDGQTTAVPVHQTHARLDWQPSSALTLWTAAFRSSGYESVRADGSVVENEGFTRLDLGASWAPAKRWLLRAKVENLTDERHFGSVVKGVSVPDQGKIGRVFWLGADFVF